MRLQSLNWVLWLSLLLSTSTWADASPQLAVHIQAQDYQHPVRIWNYSEGLWVEQGSLVEEAAKQVFQQLGPQGYAMCDSKVEAANLLVWLRPNLHYNPQVSTFYGKVTGYFYSADGKPLLRVVGESRLVGRMMGEQTKVILAKLFQQATQDLYQRMQNNATLSEYLAGRVKGQATLNPCATAEFLPVSKFRFSTFQ